MIDGIIKGTGNSRYIKTVANAMALYPTYEQFMQAFIAGEIPIDLNGINPAGWDVLGDKLNKATFLTDATATLYGKTSAATPNDILAAIRPLITTVQTSADEKCRIVTGSYVGNGKYGADNPNSLTFPFAPKIVAIPFESGIPLPAYGNWAWIALMDALTADYKPNYGFGYVQNSSNAVAYGKKSADGKTIYWYTSAMADTYQLNGKNSTYYYFAIG